MSSRFPFTPYPSGWFRVATAGEIRAGEVRPLRYFGRDLVVYRTESGEVRVTDAHCPHLGAHMGYGGRVCGEAIECPFHGWKWDGEGGCAGVPYAAKIPPNVRLGTWPVREFGGQIMVYFSPDGGPPAWELPALPEYRQGAWTELRKVNSWQIRSHVQELGENSMDLAHFAKLHQGRSVSGRSEGMQADGRVFVHRSQIRYRFWYAGLWGGAREVEGPHVVHAFGLGAVIIHAKVRAGLDLEYLIISFMTPVDEEVVDTHLVLAIRKLPIGLMTYFAHRKFISESAVTIDEDVPIWEHKVYRAQPRLVEGERPIAEFRRWAQQFYPAEPVVRLTSRVNLA